MASLIKGAPSVGQVQLLLDKQAGVVKAGYAGFMSLQAVNEAAVAAMLGDGTTANPGLGNVDWLGRIAMSLQNQQTIFRPEKQFQRLIKGLGGFIASFDTQVRGYLPGGRVFVTNSVLHPFDAWLTRQNAFWGLNGTPAPPTLTGGWTLTPAAGGNMPAVSSGNAPRVALTFIGASDMLESPPSAASAQVALSGANTAYQIATGVWGGNVPAGVYKVGVYRQKVGSASGDPYYWDQDVVVSAGVAFPTITLVNADAQLRTDWQPPQWGSCLLLPEAAALFLLAYATTPSGLDTGVVAKSTDMISPSNVALGRSDSYLGVGNTAQTAQFLTAAVTGASAATATAGSVQFTNVAAQNVQGFAGGYGLQARVLADLGGAATITIGYTYYDSQTSHGWGVAQSGTASATLPAATAGSLINFAIPADSNGRPRIVRSASLTSISGAGGAGGSFVIEAPPVRAY